MKERIDVLATNQGLFETREQAKRGVMAGLVIDSKSGNVMINLVKKLMMERNSDLKVKNYDMLVEEG